MSGRSRVSFPNGRTLKLFMASLPLMIVAVSPPAQAGIPESYGLVYSDGGTLFICPAGDGGTIAEHGISIEVHLRDLLDQPIPNFPYQDIWLGDSGTGDIGLCLAGSVADANTDAQGMTIISGAYHGGGWTQSGMSVFAAGVIVEGGDGPVLPIEVSSADLNGDRGVDMVDLGNFASDYLGTGAFRSDLDANGVVDLVDVGRFTAHFGHFCP